MKLKWALIILFCALAGKAGAQKLEWSGYGAVGYIFYNRNILNDVNQESYFEGKIQVDVKFNKKIEGQLDLRGKSADNAIKLREFTLKFEFSDYFNLKIGNLKKPFGSEYLVNEEELIAVQRSYVQESLAELGYGGRSVSAMVYYKYSGKRPEFPISYYASFFRDNSLFTGLATRFQYHFGNFSLSANYLWQNKGGDMKINTHGFGGGINYENQNFNGSAELFLVQDPYESNRRKLNGRDEKANSFGGKIMSAYMFEMEREFMKGIEPLLMASYFVPDNDFTDEHVIQLIIGSNFYVHKDVRFRLNVDLRFTKSRFNSDYTTQDSRLVFEAQMGY